jgi:hypothetical protein
MAGKDVRDVLDVEAARLGVKPEVREGGCGSYCGYEGRKVLPGFVVVPEASKTQGAQIWWRELFVEQVFGEVGSVVYVKSVETVEGGQTR